MTITTQQRNRINRLVELLVEASMDVEESRWTQSSEREWCLARKRDAQLQLNTYLTLLNEKDSPQ